jgi:hypothetical protein
MTPSQVGIAVPGRNRSGCLMYATSASSVVVKGFSIRPRRRVLVVDPRKLCPPGHDCEGELDESFWISYEEAIPGELMEAEMFGIAKGVASGVSERPGQFQLARGGTLFLDEIGAMRLPLQSKLLRALEGKEIQPVGGAPAAFETGVVAATSSAGTSTTASPASSCACRRCASAARRFPTWSTPSWPRSPATPAGPCHGSLLEPCAPSPRTDGPATCGSCSTRWAGSSISAEGRPIDCDLLGEDVLQASEPEASLPSSSLRLDVHVEQLERRLIRTALARTGGRRAAAARLLGATASRASWSGWASPDHTSPHHPRHEHEREG